MLTHVENFHQAHRGHQMWQQDRPLIDKFNHLSVEDSLELLTGEIEELNGGDKTGVFAKKNIERNHRTREDYRQQEISDILIFAMGTFDSLGAEIPAESTYSRAEDLAHQLKFELVEPGRPMTNPKALNWWQNRKYLRLRQLLNDQVEFLVNHKDDHDHEELKEVLENVLVYAVAMHSLIGVDSSKAIFEKLARNMLKYPAFMFMLSEAEKLLPDSELRKLYKEWRFQAADLFDGPQDPKTEERPKTGTGEFYTQEPELGLFYQAWTKIVATTYGFSAKVKSLLNRA